MKITIRFPDRPTIKDAAPDWSQINELLRVLGKTSAFPRNTVLTVESTLGVERYSVRGGGAKSPPVLVKLSRGIQGLPENPDFKKKSSPAMPSLTPDPVSPPPRRAA